MYVDTTYICPPYVQLSSGQKNMSIAISMSVMLFRNVQLIINRHGHRHGWTNGQMISITTPN